MEKRFLILGFVFVTVALGGCIMAGQESPADTTINNSEESQSEKIALRIAWEAVMNTERYDFWAAKGVAYKAVPRPSNAQDSANYIPELWTVDFDHPYATDQGIHVNVNIKTETVLFLYEDQA